MARAESVEERHRDDAVEAAGQFIDWQAWWSERMQENLTEERKQKRMRSIGLDEARLAEWKKWQKHSTADVISVEEAARYGRSRRNWNSVGRGRSQ